VLVVQLSRVRGKRQMWQTLGYLETKSFRILNGLGVSVCMDLGSFLFPELGKPRMWLDSTRVCMEADAF